MPQDHPASTLATLDMQPKLVEFPATHADQALHVKGHAQVKGQCHTHLLWLQQEHLLCWDCGQEVACNGTVQGQPHNRIAMVGNGHALEEALDLVLLEFACKESL